MGTQLQFKTALRHECPSRIHVTEHIGIAMGIRSIVKRAALESNCHAEYVAENIGNAIQQFSDYPVLDEVAELGTHWTVETSEGPSICVSLIRDDHVVTHIQCDCESQDTIVRIEGHGTFSLSYSSNESERTCLKLTRIA